jgi:hypothetical protein
VLGKNSKFTDIPVTTTLHQIKEQQIQETTQLSEVYKIRFVEPRTCYSQINSNSRYRMQSYMQLLDYWFPEMNCIVVDESESADIAVIGNNNSDPSSIRPNELNILISIENMPHWNQYPHYSKYGDYSDPLIDIFIYNHKSSIENLHDGKIMIPVVLFRMNYFITNYNQLKIPVSIPPMKRKFCLMVNKSGLNNKIGLLQEKLDNIDKVDHISLYDKEIENVSCYNSPELLKVFNQYRFIVCFENSYNSGYITEKIFNCLLADTIPIYSGSPIIHEYINPDCFINISENDDINEFVDKIREINSSSDQCIKYLSSPKISQKYLGSGINVEFKNHYKDAIDKKIGK